MYESLLKHYMELMQMTPALLGISPLDRLENLDTWNWDFLSKQVPHRAIFLKALSQTFGLSVRSLVEIGVYRGESSKLFKFLFPEAQLYLVDPWKVYPDYLASNAIPASKKQRDLDEAYQLVKKVFRDDSNCKILRKTSFQAASEIPDALDLVFIDGNHNYEYVKQDIELWLPKVRSGGILSGHDYNVDFPGVLQAVRESLGENIQKGIDSTWVYLKP